MKTSKLLSALLLLFLCSCAPMSYFTEGIRNKVEARNIEVDKLQFYIDRDVELRREVTSGNAKVTSGKVKFENGKFINIIILKEGTRGVCTKINDKELEIAFEVGENKSLVFGSSNDKDLSAIYHIYAQEWVKGRTGKITYDNESYYIQPEGARAQLMIQKSAVDKLEVKTRKMKGVKI